jgi:hypothetical protein
MRLGQLARKLALRPTEIVSFLAENNVQIDDGSNTRLDDGHVALVLQKFAPARFEEREQEQPAETTSEAEDGGQPEETDSAQPAGEESIPPSPTATEENLHEEGKPELIKAPKVELSGLKVIGKIELPEVKKKPEPKEEVQAEGDQPSPEKVRQPDHRRAYQPKKEFERRPAKNPIAMQREREAQEEEKKRRAATEREKEQKKKNYFKKVKAAAPTKSAGYMKESVEEMSEKELEETPKTWIGRLMKWFRT